MRGINLSPLAIFLLKAAGIYAAWYFFYDLVILPDGRLDTVISLAGVKSAAILLGALGYEIESSGRILAVAGSRGVEILNGCNGLNVLGLYAGFIIAYPGESKKRILFLSGGIALLVLANVLRIAYFALSNLYFPGRFTAIHGTSSYIFFYPIILALWYLWARAGERTGV